jgi:serine/threonine protein kinase
MHRDIKPPNFLVNQNCDLTASRITSIVQPYDCLRVNRRTL